MKTEPNQLDVVGYRREPAKLFILAYFERLPLTARCPALEVDQDFFVRRHHNQRVDSEIIRLDINVLYNLVLREEILSVLPVLIAEPNRLPFILYPRLLEGELNGR